MLLAYELYFSYRYAVFVPKTSSSQLFFITLDIHHFHLLTTAYSLISGTLNFLSLSSYHSLTGDDSVSPTISTNGAFPFGAGNVYSVFVSSNGVWEG